jgi:hypothetical protein
MQEAVQVELFSKQPVEYHKLQNSSSESTILCLCRECLKLQNRGKCKIQEMKIMQFKEMSCVIKKYGKPFKNE